MDDGDDGATALWRRTVEALLAKGATPAEAIDGAHLVLRAYRRQHEEEQAPESGPQPSQRASISRVA